MKKLFFTFIFFVGFSINVKSQIIEPYIKNDIEVCRQFGVASILVAEKLSLQQLALTYDSSHEKKIRLFYSRPSTFNQADADRFFCESGKDIIIKYWTEKDKIEFGFDEMVYGLNKKKLEDLYKKYDGLINIYAMSNTYFTNNEQNPVFLLSKSGVYPGLATEYAVKVMKKENDIWVCTETINFNKRCY